jgi:membrane fusion protein (multidrug efflux system)
MAADGGSTQLRPEARRADALVEERRPDRRDAAESPPQTASRRKRWWRWASFVLLPIVLIAGLYSYVRSGRYMSTDDALVKADQAGLSTDVSGLVKEIDVGDNEQVEAGQKLFALDPLPFRLKLNRAQAQLGVARDNLNALKANYHNMQAQRGRGVRRSMQPSPSKPRSSPISTTSSC